MHILLGVSCFLSAVMVAVLVVFLTWTLFSRLGAAKLEQIKSGNIGAATVLGAELLAFSILMKSCLYPLSAVLQDLMIRTGSHSGFLKTAGYIFGYIILGYALSVLTVFISARLFQGLTRKLDEKAEIANGNLAVAVAFSFVLVAIALMVQPGLSDLLNTLIPAPDSGIVSFPE